MWWTRCWVNKCISRVKSIVWYTLKLELAYTKPSWGPSIIFKGAKRSWDKMSESVWAHVWTICKAGGQEKFRMVSQGHITHCLRCQGDSVLIFMSWTGSLGTNMSGTEHRQGDTAATSCSNLGRSEARWFRSRIQAGWGRDWDLAGDTFTWVGQGLRGSKPRSMWLFPSAKNLGNFLRKSGGRAFPEQSTSGGRGNRGMNGDGWQLD